MAIAWKIMHRTYRQFVSWFCSHVLTWQALQLLALYFILPLALLLSYHHYLHSLYHISDPIGITEGKLVKRSLHVNDKITIRVLGSENLEDMKVFIDSLSQCPSIQEIQLMFHQGKGYDLPSIELFQVKTPILLKVLGSKDRHPLYTASDISTEGEQRPCQDIYNFISS